MFTALMLTAVLSCKPALTTMPPRPPMAETTVACEGADWVRRDVGGEEVARWRTAGQCMTVRCEGFDWVRRDSRGVEMGRWVNAPAPYCPVRPTRVKLTRDEPVRFGLSSRG